MAIDAARAKLLFLAALDLADPAERAAFLKRECGGDAELRGRVEVLLGTHDTAPLPTPEPGDGTSTHVPDHQPPTEDYGDPTARVGSVIAGKYKLMEEIGEGGMGQVFMAQQTEPVKRSVAVKVIKAGMDSKAVLARFEAERQALAMMDHPNIAKVLDAGTTEGGRPYFVMELVKGLPITKYCDERKLTPRQRLELFVPVCQAIQHAHQKGIIHRDIKPSNVLVAMYDDRAVPKVIDFGVAKAAGQTLTEKTLMTGLGVVVGTAEYMSPEQANLNYLDIDTRSDVYSLGVLLYELLTGSTPVDRKSLGQAAFLEVLRIVREVEAPKPSDRLSTAEGLPSVAANRGSEPAKLSKLMKGELDWVVLKALEKDRTRRYETANGLARDIQRYLADEVVEARPPSTGYRLKKFVRRHRGQVIAASLILLALIASVAVSVTAAVLIWQEQKKTDAERAKATENADAAIKVVQDLSSYVHAIEFSGSQAIVTAAQRKKVLDATLASYQRLLALHPDDQAVRSNIARMHRYRANLSRSLNESADATESYSESIRHYSALAAAHPDTLLYRQAVSETSRDYGLFLSRIGRLKEATGILDQSVRVYEELRQAQPDDPNYQRVLANILIDRAELDYQLGRFPDSERTARTSVALYAGLADTPGSHPETLDPLFHGMAGNRLAMVLREQGRIDEALTVHSTVVNQLTAQVKVNPTRDFLHANYRYRAERAWTLSHVPNRRAEAIADLDDALLGWEKLAKQFPDSPLYLQYQGIGAMTRGRLNSLVGQREAAAKDFNGAVKILAGLSEKYKDILVYRYDLGRSYTALGGLVADRGEAALYFRKARESLEEIVGRNPEHFQYRKALEDLNASMKAGP